MDASIHTVRNRKLRWRNRSTASILAAGAVLLAAAIPLASLSAGAATSSAVLTIAVPNVPATLNPALSDNGGNNVTFASLAYDSLIYLAPNGTYQPDLATSWKYVGSNNQEFIIQLRSGVEFSDGTTMTAQDVVNSIKYAQTTGSTASTYLTSLAAISATGPLTVQLNFSSPRPDLTTVFDQNEMAGMLTPELMAKLSAVFKALGFQYVTLDCEGYRSGSLNETLSASALSHAHRLS